GARPQGIPPPPPPQLAGLCKGGPMCPPRPTRGSASTHELAPAPRTALPSRSSRPLFREVPMFKSKTALSTCASVAGAIVLLLATAAPQAQQRTAAVSKVTSPHEQFGHNIGDDYFLVNYTQYLDYLKKMDAQSERMVVVDIGKTEEGRSEGTAIITSPQTPRKLPLIKEANGKPAPADGLNGEQARQLAREGKAVVWIDGGLHATEVLGAQQLIETIHRLNTKTDPETMRILNDVIILCTLVNPDGMEVLRNC